MTAPATYVLPIRCGPGGTPPDLTAYLAGLAGRLEVVVVDGSLPEVFADHHRAWAPLGVRHVPPDAGLECANGKVAGVLTGLRLARHDRVVVADDDVRYGVEALERTVALLDRADLVRPQNHFVPVPWHAAWDTGRILLNRLFGGDYPGTLAVRRSVVLAAGGYDGDVLFENLELIRTVQAAGGVVVTPLDLFVPRQPPTTAKFFSQRVRQAYDDFAQPARLAAALAVLPTVALVLGRRGSPRRAARRLGAAAAAIAVAAEAGRRRGGGRCVFPRSASLLAPLWVLERGVCSWLAVATRIRSGGCPYAGRIVRRAANSRRALCRRIRAARSSAGQSGGRTARISTSNRPAGAS
ncbi:MAG TPA: glycosyltransferase [Acidimicrobiia bacterium]|nr:glycosyltransferase [Acidimicrobiia bacterium]